MAQGGGHLAELIDAADLETLAGEAAVGRGRRYAGEGRVDRIVTDERSLTATVHGTAPYEVRIRTEGGALAWSCPCPVGFDGTCCKHVVALLVAAREGAGDGRSARHRELARLRKDRLVDLLVDHARTDERLDERIDAVLAAESGRSIDLAEWRKKLTAAFRTRGFVDYGRAPEWAARARSSLDALDTLLEAGHAAEVVVLAEKAHALTERSIQKVDDSDGWITDLAVRIGRLHLASCREARPEPKALARRLAELDLEAELDTFRGAAQTYADVLGEQGLAAYRKKVDAALTALDADPGSASERDGLVLVMAWRRRQVHIALEGVLLGQGDVDGYVASRTGDLRSAHDVVDLVGQLRAVGRDDEALRWARHGLEEFADSPPHLRVPLEEVTVDLLRSTGAGEDATALAWAGLDRNPSVTTFRVLAGTMADPDEARRAAVEHLVARCEGSEDPMRVERVAGAAVEITLDGGDLDGAWDLVRRFPCPLPVVDRVAVARMDEAPADAIPTFEREVAEAIARKDKRGYRRAAKELAVVRDLYQRSGDPAGFERYLASVRDEHGNKPTLMTTLDRAGF